MWHKDREAEDTTSFPPLRGGSSAKPQPRGCRGAGPAPPRPHCRPAPLPPPGPVTHLPSLRCSPARSGPFPLAVLPGRPDPRPAALTEAAAEPGRGSYRARPRAAPGLNVSDAPRAPFPLAGEWEEASADWLQEGNTGGPPAHWALAAAYTAAAGPSALWGRAEGRVRRRGCGPLLVRDGERGAGAATADLNYLPANAFPVWPWPVIV